MFAQDTLAANTGNGDVSKADLQSFVSECREEANTDDIYMMVIELGVEFEHAVETYHSARCLTACELRSGRRWGGACHSGRSTYTTTWHKEDAYAIIPDPWKQSECFFTDLTDGRRFKADGTEETSNMFFEPIVEYDTLGREADEREIKALADDKVFRLCPRDKASSTMECVWLRKWKGDVVSGGLVVQGCLNQQQKIVSWY